MIINIVYMADHDSIFLQFNGGLVATVQHSDGEVIKSYHFDDAGQDGGNYYKTAIQYYDNKVVSATGCVITDNSNDYRFTIMSFDLTDDEDFPVL
jgi:hypothetical protein